MGLFEFPLPDARTWEKIKPVFRYNLWRQRIPLGYLNLTTPGYLMMPDEWEVCHLPSDLVGKSFLDVGSNDGFFSFEAERRHASEVVAVDIYREADFRSNTSGWPETGIKLAHQYLQSKVDIRSTSILNLHSLGKHFDYVFCNNVLAWIRDMPEAIRQLSGSCSETLIISDIFNTKIDHHIIREKFEINVLSVKEMISQLKDCGWEVYHVGKEDKYKRFKWHLNTFEIIDSAGLVNVYADPEDMQVLNRVEIKEGLGVLRMNGRVFINQKGWVDSKDVKLRKLNSGSLFRLYRKITELTGLDRFIYNIRNRSTQKKLVLTARKIK